MNFFLLISLLEQNNLIIFLMVSVAVLNLADEQIGAKFGIENLSSFEIYFLSVTLALNYGGMAVSILVHILQPSLVWDIIRSSLSYFLYSPVYNHMMMAFAFCNIDDLTWGTKGLTSDSQNEKAKVTKISFVSEWLLWNTVFITFLMICFRTFSWAPKIILSIGVI